MLQEINPYEQFSFHFEKIEYVHENISYCVFMPKLEDGPSWKPPSPKFKWLLMSWISPDGMALIEELHYLKELGKLFCFESLQDS